MAQRTVLTMAGDYARANIFPVRRSNSGSRRGRYQPTSDVQAALNQKNREHYLHELILSNFTPDDKFITLTYREECYHGDNDSAMRDIRNYFRRVKSYCKKNEMGDPKYIYVTERGSVYGRLHHHVIISCGLSVEELSVLWNKGNIQYEPLIFNETGLMGYAKYFVKSFNPRNDEKCVEKIGYRAWSCSKNLIKPKKKQNDYKIRAKDAAYMDEHPDDLGYAQKLFPGYIVTRIVPTPRSALLPEESPIPKAHFLAIYMYKADTELFGEGLARKIKRKRKELAKKDA